MPNQKFNFLAPTSPSIEIATSVRIRAQAKDAYAGLRGHAYIDARQLNAPVKRVQTSALDITTKEPA